MVAAAALSLIAGAAGVVATAPSALAATTYTVNTTADSNDGSCDPSPGDCTLREAITLANTAGGGTITFSIGTGAQTIGLTSDLPPVGSSVVIDGTSQQGWTGRPIIELDGSSDTTTNGGVGVYLAGNNSTVDGLVINGFPNSQILIDGASNNINNNYLGTSYSGNAVPAAGGGGYATVRIRNQNADNNIVENNVIGGGAYGVSVEVFGSGAAIGNQIRANNIGLGADGTSAIGSGLGGVYVSTGAQITDIRANRIANNSGLGIDLGGDGVDTNDAGDADTGANNKQNYPVLDSVVNDGTQVTVSGTLNSTQSDTFAISVYANPSCDSSGHGEGRYYVGNLFANTNSDGNATISGSFSGSVPAGFDQFTATASREYAGPTYETSEFSTCTSATTAPPATPPDAPTGVTAGAGDAQAEVSWIAPASTGGAPIDHYTVSSSPEAGSTPVDVPAGTTTATIPGLTNGTNYTFTVTATNTDSKTSAASAPSESVQPQAGAPAPEAQTGEVPAGGSLSTGSSASSTDPTNTTVDSPNAGIVSIGESAMTGTAPAGHTYFGQQIDITAPDATTTDPLKFTFVEDCSVLPAGLSNCSGTTAARTATLTAASVAAPTASVAVKDGRYVPKLATVDQGGTVTWSFQGTRAHTVTDTSRLGASGTPLFNSGKKSPGGAYSYTFAAAGRYPYRSTATGDPSSMKGSVLVPDSVSQTSGDPNTAITVTWAASQPTGYRFDVQYRFKAPGGSYGSWTNWQSNTTTTSKQFTGADLLGEGDYQFRSRLENASTGRGSKFSPTVGVTVTAASGGGGPSRLAGVTMFHETDGVNVEVPDCTGQDGVAQPGPTCVWSETILADGDLQIVVYTSHNGRWRASA